MAGNMGGYIGIVPSVNPQLVYASGSIQSGNIGAGVIFGINIASGTIAFPNIASGGVQSGNISSGVIGHFHLASGLIQSGNIGSGAVLGQAGGGAFCIASGTLGTFDLGSGSIVSGRIASGQIGSFHIGSGQLTGFELGSGSIVSGRVASGQIGSFHIGSGQLTGFELGSGSIVSGRIASGQVGPIHIASGAVQSGLIGSGAVVGSLGGGAFCIASGTIGPNELGSGSVLSGGIASGQIGTYQLSSGATIVRSQFVAPVYSGTAWNLTTAETISGIRAVAINQSGQVVQAMASVSGRMPAVGVVIDNIANGAQANIYTQGVIQFTSGLFTGINYFGQPVWVGRSGQLVPMSGSFGSGGFASGDLGQKLGVILAIGSGGILLNTNMTVSSGGPLGQFTGGVI